MKRLLILLFVVAVLFSPAVSQAQAGPTFFYVGTALDVNGFESVFSVEATITFAQGQSKATATWTAPVVPTGGAAIANVKIYRSKTKGGPYALVATVPATAVSYVDIFVPPSALSGFSVAGS